MTTSKERQEVAMIDYRKFPDLNFYVAEISAWIAANNRACPVCHSWFKEPKIDTSRMNEGDCTYWICPHCGTLLKFELYFETRFDIATCTAAEFEAKTGEDLKKYVAQKDNCGSKNE